MILTTEQFDLVMKLVGGTRVRPGQQLHDVTMPLSVIRDVARSSLETNAFFPPEMRPGELGDGAVNRRNTWRGEATHPFFLNFSSQVSGSRFAARTKG
jgi:hypothetical protein